MNKWTEMQKKKYDEIVGLAIVLTIANLFLSICANNYYHLTYSNRMGMASSLTKSANISPFRCLWESLSDFHFGFSPIHFNIFFPLFFSMLGATLVICAVFYTYKKSDNDHFVGREHGDGRIGNANDVKSYKAKYCDDSNYNLIFSKDIWLSLDNKKCNRNANVLVEGTSGAGKSFCMIKPNIAQLNSSKIITDPSGELYDEFARWLVWKGKKTMVFDVSNLGHGNYYNPLTFVYDEKGEIDSKKVDVIVDIYMDNASDGNAQGGSDPFWPKAEKAFLTSLIYYTLECDDITLYDKCFGTILEKAQLAKYEQQNGKSAGETTLTKEINAWETKYIEQHGHKPLTRTYYDTFLLAPEKTANTILITTAVDLQIFSTPQVDKMTRTNVEYPELNIDLQSLAEEEAYLFLIIPVTNKAYNFLVTMMYSQMYDKLYALGDRAYEDKYILYDKDQKPVVKPFDSEEQYQAFLNEVTEDNIFTSRYSKTIDTYYLVWNNKIWKKNLNRDVLVETIKELKENKYTLKKHQGKELPIHIEFLLDEFKNIGKIPNFPDMIATCRKYKIGNMIILQDESQLEAMWEDDSKAIKANCDTYVFLGSGDPETIKRVSERFGTTTFRQKQVSYDSRGKQSVSYTPTEIPVIPISDVENLNSNGQFRCIIKSTSCPVFIQDKYKFTDHPYYREVMDCRYDISSIFDNQL